VLPFNTSHAPLIQTGIILTFNPLYSFATMPRFDQLLINGVYYTQLPTVTSVATNQLIISNLQSNDVQTEVSFTLFGIANPSIVGNYNILVSYTDQSGFTYATSTIPYAITATAGANTNQLSINLIPNSTTDYRVLVIVLPYSFLPRDALISINFINVTMNTSTVLNTGGYLYYQTLSASNMNVSLMSHLTTPDSSYIQLTLYNFTVQSASVSLTVNIQYRSTIIYSQTLNAKVGQTIPQACSASLQFYPMNSAEVASYDFLLSNTLFLQGQRIVLEFGPEYLSGISPRNLDILCNQLSGPISYTIYQKLIVIDGFYSQSSIITTNLSVFGIVNPNRRGLNLTTAFTLRILNSDSTPN
jgi:hypothetical protein